MTLRTCSVPDCDALHYGLGLCSKHYSRQRRTGSVNTVRIGHRFSEIDVVTRLWERSEWQGECLIYTAGYAARSGHVSIMVGGKPKGVHRAAWETVNGPAPSGIVIRHSCDTPRCINTDHLLAGTVADNNRDRDERRRHVALAGEANGYSKLRAEQVRAIRLALAGGESTYQVAEQYGVSQAAIWRIKAGKAWTHIK